MSTKVSERYLKIESRLRYGYSCAPRCDYLQSFLDILLGPRVERRGSFIEQDDLRILEYGSRYGDL